MNSKEFETDETISELIEKLKKGQIIPFVGAGMSMNLGLPGWNDLVERVADTIGIEPGRIREKRDLLVAIEYLVIRGRDKVNDILAHILEMSEKASVQSEEFESLASLDPVRIYTTNWDDLIESSYRRLGKNFIDIEHPADLSSVDFSKTTIIKYHGSLKHPETLVITESDYYDRFGIDSPFDLLLRVDMIERSLLFLGYSLRDYNVRYIWNRTQKLLTKTGARKPRPAYFVSVKRDEIFETVSRENNIKIIPLDNPEVFPSFIKYLSNAVKQ